MLATASAAPSEVAGEQAGVASSDNSVQMRLATQQHWVKCQVGDLLAPGDSIRTGPKSSASLLLSDQTMMRLGANTEVKLVSLTESGGTLTEKFLVRVGRTWAKVTPGNHFELRGPNAVAAVKGTVLEMDCAEGGATRVNGWDGSARFTPTRGKPVMLHRSKALVATSQESHTDICMVDPKDSWQHWNRECDQRLEVAFGEIRGKNSMEQTRPGPTGGGGTRSLEAPKKTKIPLNRTTLKDFNTRYMRKLK